MISGTTVLLVDDEELDLTTTAQLLRESACNVLAAKNYSDAMSLFDMHRESIQLLVTDIVLPDGNGCALAVAMRNQKPGLRVLFISYHVGTQALEYYGLDVTDDHFLQKPFDNRKLMKQVERVLSGPESFPALHIPKTQSSDPSA